VANVVWLSAAELRGAYERWDTTPSEVLAALVEQIETVDPALNAFTTLALERAMTEARAADATYRKPGCARALEGLPPTARASTRIACPSSTPPRSRAHARQARS
jgi:aspartyl-tRNA(Asn)/glutamyl-tRNA(Gln) amidotransferase subunit A